MHDGRLWRNGEPWFPVGVNYHPSSTGVRLWQSFPEAEITADLHAMASAGLTLVRIFVYWADLEPTLGNHDPAVLGRVRRFCELADATGLGVMVSALTVWMNGQRFFPPWLAGRDLWTDPIVRERSMAAVAAIAGAAPRGVVVAYDLGDELPHADPRSFGLTTAEVATWQIELCDTIRAVDPLAVVTQANELSSAFGRNPFGPDNRAGFDFASIHGFPYWGPPIIGSHRDPAASLLTSFLTAYSRAYGPVLIDEIGAYLAGAETTAAHLRASLPSLAAAGALGAVVWSWKDITAAGAPYERRPSERRTGLVDSSGRPRPALAGVTNFAREAAAIWSRARRRPAPVAIFVPELYRDHDDTYLSAGPCNWPLGPAGPDLDVSLFHAYLLCLRAHLPTEITVAPASHHRLIICPAPRRLTEHDTDELGRAVREGATLLVSVGDPCEGLLSAELTGVDVDDFTVGGHHGRFDFAGNAYELRWPSRVRAAVLRSVGAEVLATFSDSSPALTRFSVHAGQVWLLNAPLERQLADADDLASGKWAGLYCAIADRAGVTAPVRVDDPDVEVQVLDIDGQEKVLLVNHGWASIETTIGSVARPEERIRIAGKSSVLLDGVDGVDPPRSPVAKALAR